MNTQVSCEEFKQLNGDFGCDGVGWTGSARWLSVGFGLLCVKREPAGLTIMMILALFLRARQCDWMRL